MNAFLLGIVLIAVFLSIGIPIGWLIFPAILYFLAVLPLGVTLVYDAEGFHWKIIVGCLRIMLGQLQSLYRRLKPKRKNVPEKKPKAPQEAPQEKPKKGGKLQKLLPFLKLFLDFPRAFLKKLRVERLELLLILGGDDPCDLGTAYGAANALLANLMPLVEHYFIIQKKKLDIQCDFTAEDITAVFRMDITVTLGRLIALLAVYGLRAVKLYFATKNKEATL